MGYTSIEGPSNFHLRIIPHIDQELEIQILWIDNL